ncbi:hypothetical protein JCM8547_002618 [Rhodosporidiobolus lusitaniae]
MVYDIVRDSQAGFLVNYFSSGRLFPYDDQRSDYVVPERYLAKSASSSQSTFPRTLSEAPTLVSSPTSPSSPGADNSTLVGEAGVCPALEDKLGNDIEKQTPTVDSPAPVVEKYRWLVEFEENDQDRPQNWSEGKKKFVGALISILTFSVYIASAAYTPSIPGLMSDFGVSQTLATAGLTLFVFAYGIGPMILAPAQELPSLGRNPVYMVTLALFIIFQVPPLFTDSIAVVLVFRFLAGFVGSPALATGGASMSDVFAPHQLAIAIGAWAIGAVSGPVFGPVAAGFAAQEMGWRWTFLIQLWIAGPAFIVLFFLLPETYEPTILLRRAQRLRKLTGNPLLRAPCEVDDEQQSLPAILWENVSRAFQISIDPAILVANTYIAYVYCVFYLWFEAFPIVFTEQHHFNLGLSGLPFLGFIVSAAITFTGYYFYNTIYMAKRSERDPNMPPEARLELGLMVAPLAPISLFIFGWTAQAHTHWIGPIIGASLFLPPVYLAFQSCLMYISLSYPKYAASLLAGNDLFRSTFASVFPLFGHRFFKTLGLGGGSSLLAGVMILMIPALWAIMHYGARLRARSRFAQG